jgi:hypothetical protein
MNKKIEMYDNTIRQYNQFLNDEKIQLEGIGYIRLTRCGLTKFKAQNEVKALLDGRDKLIKIYENQLRKMESL